jgi:hypothetical protein
MLASDEAAGDVEVDGSAPGCLVELDGSSHRRITDVVVENVDTAAPADDRVHDGLDGLRIRHVTGERGRGSPFAVDNIDRLLRRFAVHIHTNDVGSVAGE